MATGGFIGFVGTIYITLLEVMAQYGCKNLVFSSSATMYDSPKEVAYTEESPISALNPYSLKKSAVMYTVLIRNGRSYCLNGVGVLIGEVDEDGKIVVDETPARLKALTVSLKAPKLAGVHGITVEVWWGIVERFCPLEFKWSL